MQYRQDPVEVMDRRIDGWRWALRRRGTGCYYVWAVQALMAGGGGRCGGEARGVGR